MRETRGDASWKESPRTKYTRRNRRAYMPAGLCSGCARRPMRGDPRGRTLSSMSNHIGLVAVLVLLGACGPRVTYLAVRDDATVPGDAAAESTVIALSNGRYLTLAP